MFDALCEAYYQKVLLYLFGMLQDEQAARDCAQEVFLVALQKEDMLRTHPNPGGFIFQTAKHIAMAVRRKGYRRLQRECRLQPESLSSRAVVQADVGTQLEAQEDAQIDADGYVDQVLDCLAEDKRVLYTLYYIAGKSMAEIAAQLGQREPAVRMRFVRLRREIRAIVRDIAEKHFAM